MNDVNLYIRSLHVESSRTQFVGLLEHRGRCGTSLQHIRGITMQRIASPSIVPGQFHTDRQHAPGMAPRARQSRNPELLWRRNQQRRQWPHRLQRVFDLHDHAEHHRHAWTASYAQNGTTFRTATFATNPTITGISIGSASLAGAVSNLSLTVDGSAYYSDQFGTIRTTTAAASNLPAARWRARFPTPPTPAGRPGPPIPP